MKLSNMSVIFIVIIIPIILVSSYYIQTQIDTLNLQTSYNSKLSTSTKQAIEAFEINTVEWNAGFSQVADSKRRDVMASINTFANSLANNMGIAGTNRDLIMSYVPGMAFTLYDGYYIYAPTYVGVYETDKNGVTVIYGTEYINTNGDTVLAENNQASGDYNDGDPKPVFDSNGNPIQEYKHVLRPFVPYSARYINGTTDVTVDYTLDNYVKIYGKVAGVSDWVNVAGYLNNVEDIILINESINVTYKGENIQSETLKEQIVYKKATDGEYSDPTEYQYIYAVDGSKIYYDPSPFIGIDYRPIDENGNIRDDVPFFRLTSKETKSYLSNPKNLNNPNDDAVDNGYIYRKISIHVDTSVNERGYIEAYQALNGKRGELGDWFVDWNNDGYLSLNDRINSSTYGLPNNISGNNMQDYSAINYYVESYAFTNWVIDNLEGISTSNKVLQDGQPDTRYQNETDNFIFNISSDNNPAPEAENYEDSVFTIHKREIIRNLINDNLNQAITKYGTEKPNLYDFRMPTISGQEWQQIESNVSLIAFLQGIPIGTKYFNGYSIATSTNNKEYADPNQMYFVSTGVIDPYYHRLYCDQLTEINNANRNLQITGYRSADFLMRKIDIEDTDNESINYFLHDRYLVDNNAEQACYYCLVDRSTSWQIRENFTTESAREDKENNMKKLYDKAYYEALGRERFMQRETKL